jgi:hypothetical protein
MLTRDDLVDAILRGLGPPVAEKGAPAARPKALPAVRGRPFLTERDVKGSLTPLARELTIPKDAIVSPLALDWLALKGIEIVRK